MTPRRACCLIRIEPQARRQAFLDGLERAGFEIPPRGFKPGKGDLMVTWNRHGRVDREAEAFRVAGGTVLVAENGYIGKDKATGDQYYALARTHHCGAGEWFIGSEDRWKPLGIELAPWRSAGENIVLLPQRGIGAAGVAMPVTWASDAQRLLKRITSRTIRVRPHPGIPRNGQQRSLSADLVNTWAAATWASGAAVKAIVMGIPVFHGLPNWIGAPAARPLGDPIEAPYLGDRLPMLRRLAWAQWTLDEIATGVPIKLLFGSSS